MRIAFAATLSAVLIVVEGIFQAPSAPGWISFVEGGIIGALFSMAAKIV